MQCAEIEWCADSMEPAPLPRAEPGEIDRVEFVLTRDVDCAGAGVSISNAAWSIRAEDDDGLLTLGQENISGLVASVQLTHDATDSQRMYAVLGVFTLSDGRSLRRWFSQPVIPIRPLHA